MLEPHREFDLGELRERRRLALPLVVVLDGMVVPVAMSFAGRVSDGDHRANHEGEFPQPPGAPPPAAANPAATSCPWSHRRPAS